MAQLPRFRQRLSLHLAMLLGLWPVLARAHPHIWATFSVSATRTGGQIRALHETWTFDEAFTAMVFQDILKHRLPKTLTRKQVASLEHEAFANMQHYAYFHHLHLGKQSLSVKRATHFNARLNGHKLVYSFDLPLNQPVDPGKAPLRVGIWDDTYYVDMEPVDLHHAIRLQGGEVAGCDSDTAPDKKHPIYYGMVFPLVTQIRCKTP